MKRFGLELTTHVAVLGLTLGLVLPVNAQSGNVGPDYLLVIQDHRFKPDALTVPAGKKIKLTIENRDATPEEFESHALNREKVIPGKSTATIFIGPLQPGRYPFVGEFNEKTALGVIVAQ
ncbi:MAG: cupredoxin domain-containing protein [Rhodocyclaceae bacterium]|nr:MAG: cupredoxin domain-containing protein [Rhodocyclaceae bacterium]